jgi:RNA-binding protein 39
MDRRTVFVNQLANRLKERQLEKFFEDNVGPVVAANIVRDRVSLRSKGVGYVQFKHEESVPKALNMTGRNLMGIPIIVQLTEAEKNRQAKAAANQTSSGTAPFHRLYVGNVHFSITEDDLRSVFSAYGAIEYVSLQTDDSGRSRGYGFVQFADAKHAKKALDEMNGFDLAGRALRVGLGNDKNHEAAQARVGPQAASFSGAGGRGVHAGGQHNYERAAHRDIERLGGASALDDTDVASVNVHSFDRYSLMKKLAREEDATTTAKTTTTDTQQPAVPTPLSQQLSRCIVMTNAFSTAEYVQSQGDRGGIPMS